MKALSSVSDWMPRPFWRADTTEVVPGWRPTASPWEVVRFVAAFVDFRTGIFVDSYSGNSRDGEGNSPAESGPLPDTNPALRSLLAPLGPIGPVGFVSS